MYEEKYGLKYMIFKIQTFKSLFPRLNRKVSINLT